MDVLSQGAAGALKRVDARGKPRQFARDRVPVQHAFRCRAMHFRLRDTERGLCRGLIAGRDRALDILDEGAHPAEPRTVDCGPFLGLPKTFFGRFMVRHGLSSATGVRLISARPVARQPPRG